jgi:hypothetical protein
MTIQSIRKILSSFNQDAMLSELPDSEFVTGGAITNACRIAGYEESGNIVVNNLAAWGMTVAKFAKLIAPQE